MTYFDTPTFQFQVYIQFLYYSLSFVKFLALKLTIVFAI